MRTAACTHSSLMTAGRSRPSDSFVDPHRFVRDLGLPVEPLQDSVPRLAVDDAPSLADLRHALGAELVRAVQDRDRR